MKYIDLISLLPEQDKKAIKSYITTYGCMESKFVSVNEWLQNWSHANQKLYKLLGNTFIREFPFTYKKTESELRQEMEKLVFEKNSFSNNFYRFTEWLNDHLDELEMSRDIIWKINRYFTTDALMKNKVEYTIKYKRPGAKKTLQIQEGAKALRALGQLINYFSDFDWNEEAFEDFRKEHSIIFSEKEVSGNVCISIHPLDYITMSDNDSNWSSCMSWSNEGCYHVGTVEMMNSNNVLCCYLKNQTPYIFNKDKIDSETGELIGVWNNKRWRQLVYVTKDIIMTGKPYPYVTLPLSKTILDNVKNLAEENLHWSYQFGPEKYFDMIHVDSLYRMNHQRAWMRAKSYLKHNILWDTSGMYNDMLNDPHTSYLCYRNKVDHTKIISVSGKANCICCNNDILTYYPDSDEYNDRYSDTGEVICRNCLNDMTCSWCEDIIRTEPLITSECNEPICHNCFNQKVRICPCCGKPMYIKNKRDYLVTNSYIYKTLNNPTNMELTEKYFKNSDIYVMNPFRFETKEEMEEELTNSDSYLPLEPIYFCDKCADKIKNDFHTDPKTYFFERTQFWSKKSITYELVDPDKAEKYRYHNLKPITEEQYKTEIIQ